MNDCDSAKTKVEGVCLLWNETFHYLKFCFWEVRVHCRTFWLMVTENEISRKKTV